MRREFPELFGTQTAIDHRSQRFSIRASAREQLRESGQPHGTQESKSNPYYSEIDGSVQPSRHACRITTIRRSRVRCTLAARQNNTTEADSS